MSFPKKSVYKLTTWVDQTSCNPVWLSILTFQFACGMSFYIRCRKLPFSFLFFSLLLLLCDTWFEPLNMLFLGPDHVQVNWNHKSIGNISQLETRPLIGWPSESTIQRPGFQLTYVSNWLMIPKHLHMIRPLAPKQYPPRIKSSSIYEYQITELSMYQIVCT